MKNTHISKTIRNVFYAVLCIITSFAFTGFWTSWILEQIPYRKEVFIACSSILLFAVFFGILKPIFKLFKNR
jgi:hypothetical protein